MNKEFAFILNELSEQRPACLRRVADGKPYTRLFSPVERLILFGAGHISQSLSKVGALIGFAVTVVDDRPEFACAERFPDAANVICADFAAAADALAITPRDSVCALTRGHQWDACCLKSLLPAARPMPRYVGMIGSRRHVEVVREILQAAAIPPERIDALHAPIGLKIGAKSPEEIAVAIAAELISVRRSQPESRDALTLTDCDPGLLRFLAEDPLPKALLLVLEKKGSAPADTGAMMAVDCQGHTRGTVGGGFPEGKALSEARALIGTGQSKTLELQTMSDPTAPEGMACGGTMKFWIEDIPAE